jgi:hypothetical protein
VKWRECSSFSPVVLSNGAKRSRDQCGFAFSSGESVDAARSFPLEASRHGPSSREIGWRKFNSYYCGLSQKRRRGRASPRDAALIDEGFGGLPPISPAPDDPTWPRHPVQLMFERLVDGLDTIFQRRRAMLSVAALTADRDDRRPAGPIHLPQPSSAAPDAGPWSGARPLDHATPVAL